MTQYLAFRPGKYVVNQYVTPPTSDNEAKRGNGNRDKLATNSDDRHPQKGLSTFVDQELLLNLINKVNDRSYSTYNPWVYLGVVILF